MSISAYTGFQGSGKTYEVVREVVVPAVRSGRRVVTNIPGLNSDAVRSYVVSNTPPDELSDPLGSVVSFENALLSAPKFFPVGSQGGFVEPGDLVIVDEAWRFWGVGVKISAEHFEFWRMHRHFAHPVTGVSCDLVVISQDIADLHRSLKSVVEFSWRSKKLNALGLSSHYVIEMWQGAKQSRKPLQSFKRAYDKAVFPLYQSYSQASGRSGLEAKVDDRQNIFKARSLWFKFAFWMIVFFGAAFYMYRLLHPETKTSGTSDSAASSASSGQVAAPSASVPPPAPIRKPPPVSSHWRLAGFVQNGSRRVVLLVSNEGRVRFESPSAFSFDDGRPIVGLVDGERVTAWSGVLGGSADLPVRSGASVRDVLP